MAISFHYMFSCPACRAVLILANQIKIKFNLINVDLPAGDHQSVEFMKVNPQKLVPVIDDNGFILAESRAIMAYLINQYAPGHDLYPFDAKKRAVIDRTLFLTAELFNRGKDVARPLFYENIWPPSKEAVKNYLELLKVLEQLKGDNKFLAGDKMSIADISMVNDIPMMKDVMGLDIRTVAPNLCKWSAMMEHALPDYQEFVRKPVMKVKDRLETRFGHELRP